MLYNALGIRWTRDMGVMPHMGVLSLPTLR